MTPREDCLPQQGLSYLVDTNLLARSTQPHVPEYAVATQAIAHLGRQGCRLCITAQNLIEFWSVATRPENVNGLGMSQQEALMELRRFEQLFVLLPDVPAIYLEWLQLVVAAGVAGRQVHDARLVAVMRTHAVTHLLTFNGGDFVRYPGIAVVHLRDVGEG
jgi:predicted nucleic acid-binding protein